MDKMTKLSVKSFLGPSSEQWISHNGSVFAFGLLIYVPVQGRGQISKALTYPLLVVLGEISFSFYLIHQIFSNYYRMHVAEFTHVADSLAFMLYMTVLLLSSYLMWVLIEMPGRRLIMGQQKIHSTTAMRRSWQNHLAMSWKPILAGLVLCLVIGFVYVIKALGPHL